MPPQNTQQPVTPAPQPQQVVEQPQAVASPQPVASDTPVSAKKRFPKWLKIVGIILVAFFAIIVTLIVVASIATNAPKKVSDQFVNDVQSGDTSAAYALTGKFFRQATTETQLDNAIKQLSPGIQGEEKVTGRAIVATTRASQIAVLVYTVETSNGTMYIKTELQKDGDTWQIVNFRSSKSPLDATIE